MFANAMTLNSSQSTAVMNAITPELNVLAALLSDEQP